MKRAIIFLAMILTFGFTQAQSFQFKGAKGYGMKITDSTLIMTMPSTSGLSNHNEDKDDEVNIVYPNEDGTGYSVETPLIMINPFNMNSGGSFIVEAIDGSRSKYVIYKVKNKWYMTMTFIDGFTGATSTSQIQLIPN